MGLDEQLNEVRQDIHCQDRKAYTLRIGRAEDPDQRRQKSGDDSKQDLCTGRAQQPPRISPPPKRDTRGFIPAIDVTATVTAR